MVCYIINDLINRELIRRDFKFLTPNFAANASGLAHENAPEEVEDEGIEEDKEEVKSLAVYLREEEKEEAPPATSKEAGDWAAEVAHVKEKFRTDQKVDSEDYMQRLRRMRKYLERIKTMASNSGSQALQTFAYLCENALNSVAIGERQLNKHANPQLVADMYKIRETKTESAHELLDLRDKVKAQIDEFDALVDKCNAVLVLALLTL